MTREQLRYAIAKMFDMPATNVFVEAFPAEGGGYGAALYLAEDGAPPYDPYHVAGYPTPEAALLALAAQIRLVEELGEAIERGEAEWPEHPEPMSLEEFRTWNGEVA